MTIHSVTIDTVGDEHPVKCACGGLNKKYTSRNIAFAVAHLHIAGTDVDLLELALAGKEAHA